MKPYYSRSTSRRCQTGMTFLEVVVSILIIGLGLAMTVSMMQASNRYGSAAEYRSVAMSEIQSIMDSMRANILGGDGYIWGNSTYQLPLSNYTMVVAQKSVTPCTGSNCTEKDKLKDQAQGVAYVRAQADMQNWLQHVNTSLPGGQAAITKADPNQNIYTVTVMWLYGDENTVAAASPQNSDSITMTFPL